MTESDRELIDAASSAIKARFKPDWHVVGAALRLRTGEIVTGVHLDANFGRIAVCAEAIAIGRAVTEYGSSDLASIVAVYHSSDGRIDVVAPCGMCREMISDYAPQAGPLLWKIARPFDIAASFAEKFAPTWRGSTLQKKLNPNRIISQIVGPSERSLLPSQS